MFLIITAIIAVIMLAIIFANVLMGVLRGTKKSLGSLIAVIASAVISAVIAIVICMPSLPIMGALADALLGALNMLPAEITEILSMDAVSTTLTYYLGMIISPFVFLICYVVISIIATIVTAIVMRKILKGKPRPKVGGRFGGVGIGLVCGLIVAVLCITPFYGLFDMAAQVVDTASDEVFETLGLNETIESLPVDVKGGSSSLKIYEYMGCGLLYDALTSAKFEDETVSLREEVGTFARIGSGVIGFVNDSEGTDIAETLGTVVTEIDKSPIIRNLLATALNVLADSELVEGIVPDMGELMNPVIDSILDVLSSTTKDTVTADLSTLVNVMDIIIDSGIVEESDSQAMLTKLGDGLISDLLVEINKNERMYPVSDEITKLSIRALSSTLGFPKDADERYDNLMNSIADVLNENASLSGAEKFENVKEDLGNLFDDYGVDISGLALEHVTEGLIEDLGAKTTGNAVKEFFIIYHFAVGEAQESAKVENGMAYLSASEEGIVENSDGTISVNGKVLEYYNADNYKESKAYEMGSDNIDVGDAATFYSANTLKSTVVTAEEILKDLGHYSDCTDPIAESQKVGDIFAEMSGVVSEQDFENMDVEKVFGDIGHVFDMMKDSAIFNPNCTKHMLTAILQSDTIIDSIGLSQKDMTSFANKINDYGSTHEHGYEDATCAIASTLGAINKASASDATYEEKTAATRNMIDNISMDNAEMITSMVSGDMVGEYGMQVGNTDTVSDSLKNMIYNMAEYKEGNPTNEDLDSEAEAVTKMLNLAMNGAGEGPMFGENGSVANTPDEFIGQVVTSNVVMGTIDESVKDKEQGSNPYGINYSSEEEKQEVSDAMKNYYETNKDDPEQGDLADKLSTLAIAMDVELVLE